MNLEFKITVQLPEDTVFAPGTDAAYLSGQLAGFTTQLVKFYSASKVGSPKVRVCVQEIPEPLIETKVTIV